MRSSSDKTLCVAVVLGVLGVVTACKAPAKDASQAAIAEIVRVDDAGASGLDGDGAALEDASPPADADEHAAPDASADAEARVRSDAEVEAEKAEKMAREGKRGCAGTSHLITARGDVVRCYPYRCRAGACLTRCRTTDDCVPSAKPGQSLYVKGWPILCGGHVPPGPGKTAECLPLAPHDVLPDGH